jgi:AP-1 complex subunit mu
MLSSIYITDLQGQVILFRNYRGDTPNAVAELFQQKLADRDEVLRPVVPVGDGLHFVSVKHNNVYLVAVTQKNSHCAAVICFLYKLVQVMQDYFNELEQESIRDNFVLVYELLDEMMDFGYPQITESKILKA